MNSDQIKIKVCLEIIKSEIEKLTKFDEDEVLEFMNEFLFLQDAKDSDIGIYQHIFNAMILEKHKRLH